MLVYNLVVEAARTSESREEVGSTQEAIANKVIHT